MVEKQWQTSKSPTKTIATFVILEVIGWVKGTKQVCEIGLIEVP